MIGVDERREDGRATGIPAGFTPIAEGAADAEVLRLEAMLRDGVAPRIVGVRIRRIRVDGGIVLVLRIPRTWAGLHQVTYQNTARFYARNNAGKYQMDVHEIALAFRSSADVTERVRQVHRERLDRIIADRYIPILAIEQQVIEAVDRMLLIVRDCDFGLPVSISISLTNVNGKEIPLGGRRLPRIHPTPIDRDVLNLPDVLVQEHGLSTSRILRPAFDALWQAGGFPQSRNYNAAGEWAPER